MEILSSQYPSVRFDFYGRTDVGQQRESNQDQFLIAELRKSMQIHLSSLDPIQRQVSGDPMGTLMVVADGIGGGPAGDVASQMAIQEVNRFVLNSMHWLLASDPSPNTQFVDDLIRAVESSHQRVRRNADQNLERFGMGSTLTLAYIVWPNLYVVHVGDTRCYLFHQGQFVQITSDQTMAQTLCDSGMIGKDEVSQSRFRNVLWSCIGSSEQPTAVTYQQTVEIGDLVLLCSDGVTRYLNDDDLRKLADSDLDSQQICDEIISRCNQQGGADNITAVVTRCDPAGDGYS